MANILLSVNNDNRLVSKNRSFAGVQLENIYDSFIIRFSKEFVNGNGILEYISDCKPKYVTLNKNIEQQIYYVEISSLLISEDGVYPFQVRIQDGDKIFKSRIFELKIYPSINAGGING